jgi:WD40 repeat protein
MLEGHKSNVTFVSFHSDGKWLVAGSEDSTIKVWDLLCVMIDLNPCLIPDNTFHVTVPHFFTELITIRHPVTPTLSERSC